MSGENSPSNTGLIRCLQMLCDEAATLNLVTTRAALQHALAVCEQEIGTAQSLSEYRSNVLH